MGLLLKQLFNFIKILNSETGTIQISVGIACGFILGMAPALSLQTLLVFLVIFFFRVQAGAAFISAFFFAFIAFLLDPVFHLIGTNILELESLRPLFTTLYNIPLIPLTRFNNSIVMGAGVTSIILSPLVFMGSKILVEKYREKVLKKFKETKFWRAVKATKFYKWYYSYDQLYG